MSSGLLMMGSSYAVRTMVVRFIDMEAAGLYQSAWTLGGLYAGFILQAMGADFYPRLTGIANDNDLCNRLLNEQTQVSVLLAGPGLLATLTFAPLAIYVLYSTEFAMALEVLRWICLGMALRVLTWPLGFLIMAKGEAFYFLFTELAWTFVYISLAWISLKFFGLNGAGIAFFSSYVFHGLLVYALARRLSNFAWSTTNMRTALAFLSSIALVFCGYLVLPSIAATALGASLTLLSLQYSLRTLFRLVPLNRAPSIVQGFFKRLRLWPTNRK